MFKDIIKLINESKKTRIRSRNKIGLFEVNTYHDGVICKSVDSILEYHYKHDIFKLNGLPINPIDFVPFRDDCLLAIPFMMSTDNILKILEHPAMSVVLLMKDFVSSVFEECEFKFNDNEIKIEIYDENKNERYFSVMHDIHYKSKFMYDKIDDTINVLQTITEKSELLEYVEILAQIQLFTSINFIKNMKSEKNKKYAINCIENKIKNSSCDIDKNFVITPELNVARYHLTTLLKYSNLSNEQLKKIVVMLV